MNSSSQKIICTHNGTFHCDEALAVFMLRCLSEWQESKIIRSRDHSVINSADIVVDVGGVYDPEKLRFDHHQRGFNETFNDSTSIKLSSAGLVYKHFGKQIIKKVNENLSDEEVSMIHYQVYKNFIEEIDANDNGIEQYDSSKLREAGIDATHRVTSTIAARVSGFNPDWNDEEGLKNIDQAFMQGVEYVGSEFMRKVEHYSLAWIEARKFVKECYEKRFQNDEFGRIMVMSKWCPWKGPLYEIENEYSPPEGSEEDDPKRNKEVKFIVLYDDTSDSWRVTAVPKRGSRFENRVSHVEAWRGMSGDKLVETCGLEGAIFVHASGFTAGIKSFEGAINMAMKSLDTHQNDNKIM